MEKNFVNTKQTAREVVRGAFTRTENTKQYYKNNAIAVALWEALRR
jgi:hypothetical protein